MTKIGKLSVEITADAKGLASGIKDADGQISDFGGKVDGLTSKLKYLGPVAIAAGAAFGASMLRNVADTADALAKLSQKTGVTVEDLSRLQYAANLSGVSADQLSSGITRLSRGMAEAASGTGEASKAFDAMGISVKSADGTLKNQRQMLEELADRFATYADGAEKSALAQQIFGRSGAELIPLLNSGAKGIREMSDESDALGNTLNEKTAKAAEQFNDNLTRLNTAIGGISRQIAGPLIEALASFTSGVFKAYTAGETFFGSIEQGMRRMGAANDLQTAEKNVADLQKQYDAAMKTVAHLEPWEQATHGIMSLGQNLDFAKARLEELKKAAATNSTTPKITAPTFASAAASQPAAQGRAKSPEKNSLDEWFEKQQKMQEQLDAREAQYWNGRVKKVNDSLLNESELLNQKLQEDLERLNAATLTEDERRITKEALELEHLMRMGEIEDEAHMLRIKAEEDAAAQIERIRLASMTNLEKFTAMSYQEQAKSVFDAMRSQLTSVTTNSKAMFNIQKAANISQAVMDTYAGASRALKDYPAPWSYGVAAATLAAGMSRVASIKSQSFGGASAAGGGGGSAAGVAASNGMAAQQGGGGGGGGQNITINGINSGDLFGGESVRMLIDKLIDAQRNGARIVLA
jgi:hypothetical protein